MKSKKTQITLVVILSVAIVLAIVGIAVSFYMPTGKKGIITLGPLDTAVTEEYAQDIELEGFVATSNALQQ